MLKADFKIQVSDLEIFKKFKKAFRKEVIENGLDKPLADSLEALKADLSVTLNKEIPSDTQPVKEPGEIKERPALAKSDQTIMKELFDSDLSKFDNAKDFTELTESKVVFAHPSKNQEDANRVTIRMYDEDGDIEEQFAKAREYFNNGLFVFENGQGELEYYYNAGEDLSDYIKVKCSTQRGVDPEYEPYKGLSPRDRFDRDLQNKQHVQWTLPQQKVEEMRKNADAGVGKIIKVTDVMDAIKEGDFEAAKEVLKRIGADDKAQELQERIEEVEKEVDVTPQGTAYLALVKLVKNLTIEKKVTESEVVYTVVSSDPGKSDEPSKKFLDELPTILTRWVVTNQQKWFQYLVEKTTKLINKLSA